MESPSRRGRSSAFEKGWRWCRRRPVIAGLTAAVVVAILGGLIGTSLGLIAAPRVLRQKERAQTELAEQRLYDDRMNLIQRYWENNHRQTHYTRCSTSSFQPIRAAETAEVSNGSTGGDRSPPTRSRSRGIRSVFGVAFSPDGKRLASASGDRTVKVWDAATGQEILTLKGHTDSVTSVAFSPDGKRIASCRPDGRQRRRDGEGVGRRDRAGNSHPQGAHRCCHQRGVQPRRQAARLRQCDRNGEGVGRRRPGRQSAPLRGNRRGLSVAFSPDGKRLAAGQ